MVSSDRGPACTTCGTVTVAEATAYGPRWSCSGLWSCCGLWSWSAAQPLANAATHRARQAAHRVFDPLWKAGDITRSRAYRLLAAELGLPVSECHMRMMTAEQAQRVPKAVRAIRKALRTANRAARGTPCR